VRTSKAEPAGIQVADGDLQQRVDTEDLDDANLNIDSIGAVLLKKRRLSYNNHVAQVQNSSARRGGRLVAQPTGYEAFVPAPLPPDPRLDTDSLHALLSRATLALGRLDGVIDVIPDPDFFVAMYVRREAVLSSQIEGTQSTLEDLLEIELEPDAPRLPSDVGEIVAYVRAMNYGLARLDELPLSLRLIREIHEELLRDGRGSRATPGEFRTSQNWIGPAGASLAQATYVPPPAHEMLDALSDFERFLHAEAPDPLLQAGLAHVQFETIHPFLDGNGRIGRLLITLLLVREGVLRRPLLYLSHHFKLHRAEYYDRLMAVRLDGDWEGWMRFFLEGVALTAEEARRTALEIFRMREEHRTAVMEHTGQNGLKLLSELFRRPLINVNAAAAAVEVTFPTANRLVARFEELGLLREVTGQRRARLFRYEPYLSLFDDPSPVAADAASTEVTER
jgi:Fic family protein